MRNAAGGWVVPFHSSETLHPKIIKQVLQAIEEASVEPIRPE
jgi:predicted RNA binding protein YcfA (HicA-like mRNA interferase family)